MLRASRYIITTILVMILVPIVVYFVLGKVVNGAETRGTGGSSLDDFLLDDSDSISDSEYVKKEKGWDVYSISETESKSDTNLLTSSGEGKKILLLGVDSRDDNLTGRSDSILLLNLTKEDGIDLVSIPRDSYSYIDGYGYDKINHAYAFGGSDLSKKAVEDFLNIKIDNVVSINFQSFERVIDILGGVEVDSSFSFSENLSNGESYYFPEGKQLLTGEQALAYVRMRKSDAEGDLGRGKRQQEVLESLIREGSSFSNVFKIKSLYSEISSNVESDIELVEVLELVPYINKLSTVNKYQLSGKAVLINNISYFKVDNDSLIEIKKLLN